MIELLKILLLIMLVLEGALMLYDKRTKKEEQKERTTRREVYGTFRDPFGDTYRRNSKGQLTPIHPNSKMIDGVDEDEV